MDEKNITAPSAEELEAEKAATAEAKEDEVRNKVIEEYGFDATDDADRIEKLTKERMTAHQTKASLTKQKVTYREKVQELSKTKPPEDQKKLDPAEIDKTVNATLEKRDLEDMSYPDDIKKEIQRVAQIQGISVKQAARDPYIVSKIEAHEKQQKIDEAAISRTNKNSGGKKTFSLEAPPTVDMTTEEGRKEWDEWKIWAKAQGM